ncbi:MAG: hypothetical protein ABIQ31_23640 [Ferruginibacter sp.]
MKKQSVITAKIDKSLLSNLTPEVKETIAFHLIQPKRKVFSAAELWNIQRQGKARVQRRFL